MRPPAPALYEAQVTHTRSAPLRHRFRHRTFYTLVDIDDPPRLLRPLADHDRPGDHVDVRAELAAQGLSAHRILRLASPRTLGHVFNPISVHWCYDEQERLVAVVAEVHNTYGGRHAYVLPPNLRAGVATPKRLYVSPFYPVDGSYQIRLSEPGERVSLSVTLHREGDEPFVATLTARRRPYTARNLLALSARYPVAPLRVSGLIRRHGIALWARGLKVQPR